MRSFLLNGRFLVAFLSATVTAKIVMYVTEFNCLILENILLIQIRLID